MPVHDANIYMPGSTQGCVRKGRVLNVKCLEYSSPSWARSVFANDQAVKWAKAKVCVYADPVCMCWTDEGHSRSNKKMERSSGRSQVVFVPCAVGIDGEAIEFEWKNFPGFTTLGILAEIQKMMTESKCKPEQFKGRIIFMSMFSDRFSLNREGIQGPMNQRPDYLDAKHKCKKLYDEYVERTAQ